VTGRSVKSAKSDFLNKALEEPKTCALVYPTSGLINELKESVIVKTLIFIDGTWEHAKEVFNASPELHDLHRLTLDIPVDYRGAFTIRKPVGLHDSDFAPVSTAEAVALAVDQLSHSSSCLTATRRVLKAYSDQQLSFAKASFTVKHQPNKKDYIPNLYSS